MVFNTKLKFVPVRNDQRIPLLDVLRGIALLGVLLANLHSFAYPRLNGIQEILNVLVSDILINTKFLSVLAILFGAGFYYQWRRLQGRSRDFKMYFAKRMGWLFIIGSIHAHLLWFGDILRIYALCGLLLLLISIGNSKKILRWSLIFAIPLTSLAFIAQQFTPYLTSDYPTSEQIEWAFRNGGYLDIIRMNWAIDPIRHFQRDSILTLVSSFGKVLLGVWMASKGIFDHPANFGNLTRHWIAWGATIGLLSSAAFTALGKGFFELNSPWLLWVPFALAGGLLLHALLYVAIAARWVGDGSSWIARGLSAVGKMSLTNYLMQTVICIFLFYGIGLGWGSKIDYITMLGIGIVIFGGQVLLSICWLRYFKMGPVERLWRILSYPRHNQNLQQNG